MRLDGELGPLAQAAHFLRGLDHADHVHVERDVDELVAVEHRFELLAKAGGQVLALGPDRQALDVAFVEDVARGFEEILVEMDVDVGEKFRHRVGAHVLDPGRIHREMQVDGGHHESGLPRRIAEVEHRERPIAEIAAVVEELAHVFRVLGAAHDDGVDALAIHHRLQALLVEDDRLALHWFHSRREGWSRKTFLAFCACSIRKTGSHVSGTCAIQRGYRPP
jgi:hypothetical protein